MKRKTIISLVAAISLVGQAHAEPGKFRQWLQDKTNPQAEPVAQPVGPVQAQPLTAEQQQCNRFLADIRADRIEPTRANQAQANDCRNRVLAPAEASAIDATNAGATNLPPVEVQGAKPAAKPQWGKVMDSGAKGCGVGAMLGGLIGVDPTAACAVGGLVSGGFNYNKQLKQARAVETAANAAGGQASVQTSQVADAKGNTADRLEALNLSYPGAAMGERSATSMALLDKITALSKSSKEELTFTFTGSLPVCRVPIEELGKRGALQGQTVIDHCGKGDYGISISPVPDVR